MNFKKSLILLVCIYIICISTLSAAPEVRLKDIAYFQGIRNNQLSGIGIVTGLSGKGDSQGSELLKQTMSHLLSHFGIEISTQDIKSKNCAVVMVTMEVESFIRPGDRGDIVVSSIGDARSLEGGVLLQTTLQAANTKIYASAQGKILVSTSKESVKTVGSIPGGALIERDIITPYQQNGILRIILNNPDFVTAYAVEQAIKAHFEEITVKTHDAALIEVTIPQTWIDNKAGFIAALEILTLVPDVSGKVVINPNTGIIIIGEHIKIGTVAVSYRDVNVTVRASSYYEDDQESPDTFVIKETATVHDLIEVLRAAGLKADIIIGILQAIERAGALYGSLVIM